MVCSTYNHTTTGHDVLRVVVFPDSSGCPILYDTITLKHSSAYLVETAGPIIAPFTDGYVIDLKAVGDFSLVAEPCPASAESVVFNLNGSDIATESQPPYAINGDDVTTFDPWLVDTGSHILIIKAFSGNGGNGTPYPADTFHFSVVDSLPSVDCEGIKGGTAMYDDCGICTGGSTGLIPNADKDSCGVCFGGNTAKDCNGDCFGTAFIDSCGDCAGGSTGLVPNSGCNVDCNGDINGSAYYDDCNICVDGNTGKIANTDKDSCGVCFGNNSQKDCHGDCFGTAFIDDCGVCAGGSTGNIANTTCTPPCVPLQITGFTLVYDDLGGDIGPLVNGDILVKSVIGGFSIRAEVCSTSAIGSVVFNVNGNNVQTEGVAPYAIAGDNSSGYYDWNPAEGTYTLIGTPYYNGGGNGTAGIADTITFTVLNDPPPTDCHGDTSGTASVDACGVCAGGATGKTPNATCTDCNGEPNGTASFDACGICTGGSTGVIPNASCTDCNGDLFGLAVIDACGDCAGGNTTLVPNAACTDCNGDINGTAVVDSCGDCVLGATGAAFNSGCNIDCNGVVDGTALLDSCGVCAGGNTGVTPNTVCLDCHGDLNGTAFFDACGDCAGGNTALVPNAACTDCHGDVNGTAFTDTCGVCAGGNTGTVPDQSCATCVQLEVVSLTLMQAGSGGPIRQLLNGDVIYKSTTGPFSVRADVCDQPVGSVVFNVNGNNIQTESVFPYAINGDGGGSFNQWDPAPGNYIITAMPYSNNGGNGTAGIAETVTITVMNDPPPTDCHGDTNGTASVDACGVCAGGATGKTPNATCTDCNGEPNGTASFDACGICTGGSTGVIPNASCTDCNGDLFGLAAIDACGDCAGGNTTLVPNAACTDCNGDINGTAVVDSCGDCVLGATGAAFNSGCNIDCNGVVDGTALLDSCGVCAGGNTGVTPNTVCLDCHGDLNGTAFFDACGDCAGGNTALVPNAACTDCHGDVNGTAFTDTCGVCAGGGTGWYRGCPVRPVVAMR
ncbi:MAG: hypothetical protein U5L96_16640 [Owenweeksia sp.]|nr:hypothetical protein [Owenweeksia sp.]